MPNSKILITPLALALALALAASISISLVECSTLPIFNHLGDTGIGYTVTLQVGVNQVTALFSTDNDLTVAHCTGQPKPILCSDRHCKSFPENTCRGSSGSCSFNITTASNSRNTGFLSTQTLTLGSKTGSVTLGCGDSKSTPVAGFGRSALSIPAQMNINAFAYCLSSGAKGKLGWDQDAGVPGGNVLPLVKDSQNPFFLFVGVASVGPAHGSPVALGKRRMLISTGTTLTKLPANEKTMLNQAVQNYIRAKHSKLKPSNDLLDTCYNVGGDVVPGYFPDIELKSGDGKVVVVVPKESAFVAVDAQHMCLAVDTATGDPILGSLWQRDFKVGINMVANTISFKYTNSSSSSCV